MATKNLGQIAALFVGTTAPNNTNLLWRDTSTAPAVFKYWNGSEWVSLIDESVGIPEAPNDGGYYIRRNESWENIVDVFAKLDAYNTYSQHQKFNSVFSLTSDNTRSLGGTIVDNTDYSTDNTLFVDIRDTQESVFTIDSIDPIGGNTGLGYNSRGRILIVNNLRTCVKDTIVLDESNSASANNLNKFYLGGVDLTIPPNSNAVFVYNSGWELLVQNYTDQRAIDAVKEYPSTFSNVVNLTKDQFQKHQVAGAINYELGTDTHIVGIQRRDVLVADGINKPTFNSEFTVAYDDYSNSEGVKNLVIFEYVDDNEVLVYILNISSFTTNALLIANNLSDLNDVSIARTNLNVYSKAEIDSVARTGSVIEWDRPATYGSIASPVSGTLTDSNTNARAGLIQKIYFNDATLNVPADWVLLGSETFDSAVNNIIFVEWVSSTRKEYWIVKEA